MAKELEDRCVAQRNRQEVRSQGGEGDTEIRDGEIQKSTKLGWGWRETNQDGVDAKGSCC